MQSMPYYFLLGYISHNINDNNIKKNNVDFFLTSISITQATSITPPSNS